METKYRIHEKLILVLLVTVAVVGALLFLLLANMLSYYATLVISVFIGYVYLIWRKPELGLYFVLFLVPFDRMGGLTPGSVITYAKIAIAVLIGVWIAKTLIGKETDILQKTLRTPLTYLAVLFILFSIVSVINAGSADMVFAQTARRMSVVVLFLLILACMRDKIIRDNGLLAFVLGMAAASYSGLYEIFTGERYLELSQLSDLEFYSLDSGGLRTVGMNGEPNFYCISMGVGLILALYLFMRHKGFWMRALLAVIMVDFAFNILTTGSRGGTLMVVGGLAVFLVFSTIERKLLTAGAISAAVITGGFLYILFDPDGALQRLAGDSGTFALRVNFLMIAMRMIIDHPFLGVGTGNYPLEYLNYDLLSEWKQPQFPANSFIQIWAENGVIAFIVYILLFYYAFKLAYYVIKRTKDPDEKNFAATALALLFGLMIFALTNNVLENEHYWLTFALCAVAYWIYKEKNESDHFNFRGKRLIINEDK